MYVGHQDRHTFKLTVQPQPTCIRHGHDLPPENHGRLGTTQETPTQSNDRDQLQRKQEAQASRVQNRRLSFNRSSQLQTFQEIQALLSHRRTVQNHRNPCKRKCPAYADFSINLKSENVRKLNFVLLQASRSITIIISEV